MNGTINNYNQKELSGRDARLWKEWKDLDTLCAKRKEQSANPRLPSISYIIRTTPNVPSAALVNLNLTKYSSPFSHLPRQIYLSEFCLIKSTHTA